MVSDKFIDIIVVDTYSCIETAYAYMELDTGAIYVHQNITGNNNKFFRIYI